MKKLTFILLALISINVSFAQDDRAALVAFYNATGGPSWSNNTNWLSDEPISTWYGVTVENERVIRLVLANNNLSGYLPSELGSLTGLRELSLWVNKITGQIPTEIGNLTNLQMLQLQSNQLTGAIPTQVGQLTNLSNLFLQSNQFSGMIPVELGQLTNLRTLYLSGNLLSGEIPLELGQLTNLTNFNVSGNQLSGEIPVELGQLTNLQYFYLDRNQLTGEIPSEIGQLSSLIRFALSNNQLSGGIPAGLGQLINLQQLFLNDNQLSGEIPVELGQLTDLQYFYLFNNQLTGSIPTQLEQLTKLRFLYLNNNLLSGFLPTGLCNISTLEQVRLYNNLFDEQSCAGFQCLIDKDLIFGLDQPQKNGFIFPTYCNPNLNRSLMITESRMDGMWEAYVELTNMADNPVQLSEYEFGTIRPWSSPWVSEANRWFMLPEKILQPGESYVISTFRDFGPEQWLIDPAHYQERATKKEWEEIADLQFHVPEPNGDETDEIIGDYHWTFEVWSGRDCWYLRQHLSETESVVIDQVGGVFDLGGSNSEAGFYDVAGVQGATGNSILVRKYSVKSGNIDFANGRGVGPEDSEWMPIPRLFNQGEPWRDVFWTAGNHGDYNLDETTLVSNNLFVDWANKTITAPWGTRNNDDFMREFDKKPGLAWHYHLSEAGNDLEYMSARTGDRITIYACGNDLEEATFDIIVNPPTEGANIVIPKHRPATSNFFFGFGSDPNAGQIDWPRVTKNDTGSDIITGSHFGIPFATRVDTLLKYLEKAPNASWEIVFADGIQKAEIRDGDILRITAENKDIKDYFIQVQAYRPSNNADLAAIIWPDIPEVLRGNNGWKVDTIPGFSTYLYEYTVNTPYSVVGTPVFVPIPKDKKATYKTRIINPTSGNFENKTIEYTITAEDSYTVRIYTVNINKLKDPANIQPFHAEPFLSEFIFWDQWKNSFGEICNPGTEPLDLSDYMIAMDWINDPAEMIIQTNQNNWLDRYDKYIPGYKWKDEANWNGNEYIVEPDPSVNPIIQPRDVFTFGAIVTMDHAWIYEDWQKWPVLSELDVQFNNYNGIVNPWGEQIGGNGTPIRKWSSANWYLFKILNKDVKNGLKPATDPNDFELVETFGMGDGTNWVIGGETAQMITNWIRKPEYCQGKPGFKESFGTNLDDTEWTWTNQAYWQSQNVGWPWEILNITNDLGKHNFKEITDYQSVVYSNVYKVSPGYSFHETITGLITGTTVGDFLANIIKANEGQNLIINGNLDGSVLNVTDVLSNEDILTVHSSDGTNTTQYIIGVSNEGFSNDTEIIPVNPEVVIVQDNTLTGFDYGTSLQTVMQNIVVPEGATVTVLDANSNPVPLTTLNYQGEYVNVSVNANITIVVTAEDGTSTMSYEMEPVFQTGEIFVASDYFEINQEDEVVGTVEPGTTVEQLLANLYSIPGATITIIDKYGVEKTTGPLYPDDELVVTYDENTYFSLKALAEPLVRKYKIFVCDTPVAKMIKTYTAVLNNEGHVLVSLNDITDPNVGGCGTFWITMLDKENKIIENVSYTCENLGNNYVTVALNNLFGRVSTAKAKVIVSDKTAPVALCNPATVQLDQNGEGSVLAEELDNGSWDLCSNVQFSVNKADFNCSDIGTNTILLTVHDGSGNTSVCETSVNVEYNVSEVATCKPAIIYLDVYGQAKLKIQDINGGKINACNINSIIADKTEFSCGDIGTQKVVLTVEDLLNSYSTCEAEVTVVDNISPVITATDVVDEIENLADYIITSDNCEIASLINDAPDKFTQENTFVKWTVTDKADNESTTIQKVTVTNLPPEIISIEAPVEPVAINNLINTTAVFEDFNLDKAVWDWGDGETSIGDIGEGIIKGEHTYLETGVYAISLKVIDAFELEVTMEHRYVVIYDPEGGFATGGGWIDSPPGALAEDPGAAGIAEFGFVSKYKKGATIPEGNTEFKFKAGNLDFRSSEYEWLVIAGSKAKFKGKGTINGEGEFGFMISAIDGDLKDNGDPDMFRIKIWNLSDEAVEAVVYDNQMGAAIDADPLTAIDGGSIVIHNPQEPDNKSAFTSIDTENNYLDPDNFKVYPNPTSDVLKITGFTLSQEYLVKLFEITGREILVEHNKSSELEINLSKFPSGIYNLVIQLEGKSVSFHVIKR